MKTMKVKTLTQWTILWTIVIAMCFLLSSCFNAKEREAKEQRLIICNKSYLNYTGDPMPPGICRYWYRVGSMRGEQFEFQDSSSMYKIGDMISDDELNGEDPVEQTKPEKVECELPKFPISVTTVIRSRATGVTDTIDMTFINRENQ